MGLIKPVDWINYVLILSSIAITIMSVYLSSENYVRRANEIKNNYTKLAELEIKIELLIDENLTAENLEDINCEYQELLRQVENHSSYDYENALGIKSKMYWVKAIYIFVLKAVVILVPLICLVFYLYQTYC